VFVGALAATQFTGCGSEGTPVVAEAELARAEACPASMRSGQREALTCRTGRNDFARVASGRQVVLPGIRAAVRDVAVTRATSRRGCARGCMRVSLRIETTNLAAEPLTEEGLARRFVLRFNGRSVAPDAQATRSQSLLRSASLAPGSTRTGELYFELGGAGSRAYRAARTTELVVEDRSATDAPRRWRGIIRLRA